MEFSDNIYVLVIKRSFLSFTDLTIKSGQAVRGLVLWEVDVIVVFILAISVGTWNLTICIRSLFLQQHSLFVTALWAINPNLIITANLLPI